MSVWYLLLNWGKDTVLSIAASDDPVVNPSHLTRNPIHNPISRQSTSRRQSSTARPACDGAVVAIDVVGGSLVQRPHRRRELEEEGIEEDDYQ